MKKSMFWIVALLLCLLIGTASASVEQAGPEVCYSYSSSEDGSNPSVYFLVEVVNNGSSAVALDYDSTFSIYDASGVELDNDNLAMLPETLQPGQKGYVYGEIYAKIDNSSVISSYKFNLVTDTSPLYRVDLYEGEAVPEDDDVYVRFTNNTSETLWDTYGYIVALDAQGRPLYINDTIAYQVGIPTGQSLEYPMFFNSGLRDFLTENGMAPASYEAGVFIHEIDF
ncbi:MAG: hypothetical protein E7331_06105 [Clostridiales bacterium]|nr:hypothetical protein [Clostridiales bacterium]